MTIKKQFYVSNKQVVTNSPTVKIVPNKNKSKQKPHLVDLDDSFEPKSVFRYRTWNIGNT